MRKDIPIKEVTQVGVAFIPEEDKNHGELWVAHLVNLNDFPLKNVLVNVEGREIGDNTRRTATMRYLISELAPLAAHEIEVIMPDVMGIRNQFWVSYSHDNYLYDKKIIVPPDAGSVCERIGIPVLHKEGLWFD